MNKFLGPVAGALMSGGLMAGAYVAEQVAANDYQEAAQSCIDEYPTESPAYEACVDVAESMKAGDGLGVLQVLGGVGVIGFGWITYAGVKKELDVKGPIQTFL